MGFALPARITAAAVRSYRTFSPLPDSCPPGGIVFCGTFRKTRFERVPPAVSRHVALWRPDFPPARLGCPAQASGCRDLVGNPLPDRHARSELGMQCSGSSPLLLPAAAFGRSRINAPELARSCYLLEAYASKRPFTRPQRLFPFENPRGEVDAPGLFLRRNSELFFQPVRP